MDAMDFRKQLLVRLLNQSEVSRGADDFESLRPFLDENRRTGRLFLNWQLLRAGFPLTVIQVEEKARYLDALEQGHAGNLLPLQILLAAAVERSLDLTCST